MPIQPAVLRSLEFDRIREILAGCALTPLGRERALALDPSVDPEIVRTALDLTVQAVAFVDDGGNLALSASDDLPAVLDGLQLGDYPLEPLALVALAGFIESVEAVAAGIRRDPRRATAVSGLASIAARVEPFTHETSAVRTAIEPTGEISDRASPALRDIRVSLRRQRAKLRSSLEGLAHGRETAKYLQDQIVTDRNGRYVLIVRAEHRDAIPGIVHGSSGSGASLYLEPLQTVALNNEIVTLAERETAEIRRILAALTDAFRARVQDLDALVDAAAALDLLYAKAALARRMDGVPPAVVAEDTVEFLGARHPLLIGGGVHAVASDLSIVAPARALVISGPNTGGKTVALKAVGVLSLMAQAGLLIPVEGGSRFSPFRTVFADIGDEQSISANLSTFSSHIANIVSMDRSLELPALVLLDEVGSGTDPQEGGALGAALIDHFRQRGALVVATTHDDAVKSYAATTPGVVTAGFGFHPETYAPTYRLNYGAPGRSLALEIAERLGVPPAVIADARSRQSDRETQLAAHLARVDRELAALERERTAAAQERARLADERRQLLDRETRLTEREAVLKRRLDDRMNERLREARAEVDRIVGTLKQKAESLTQQAERRAAVRGPVLNTGELGSLRAEARAALDAVGESATGSAGVPAELPALDGVPSPGDTVFVTTINTEAVVRDVKGKHVEVDVRGKRLRVPLSVLRHKGHVQPPKAAQSPASPAAATTPAAALAGTELVLIGSTVDAAIDRVEKFLDDALLADEKRLRIVHGYGTGRLRDALRTYFRAHPLVAHVTPGGEKDGGDAVTIVELKD